MADIHPVTLPKWGLEMAEGTIAAWHVAEGAEIEKGADFVDIETEKIVNTLDVERGGTVRRLLANPGDVLPVGTLIAVLAPASVSDGAVEAFIASFRPVDASFDPDAAPQPADTSIEATPPGSLPTEEANGPAKSTLPEEELRRRNEAAHATPIARRVANQRGIDLSAIKGNGRAGRISQADVEAAAGAAGADPAPSTAPVTPASTPEEIVAANAAVHASPIARKVADRLGLALAGLAGSGRKGRVSLADLEAAAAAKGLEAAIRPAPPTAGSGMPPAERMAPVSAPQAEGVVAFTALRRTIAQTLVRAKQTVPHFYTTMDIEADALMALRAQINVDPASGVKVSVNDFVLRAAALALARHPAVNAHVHEDGVRLFDRVDIAVAVSIEGGLVAPAIRDVAARSVSDIAREAKALAGKARSRTLAAEDLRDATFTVTNLGMYGVRQFDAIISPPQAAILAVGGARREAREAGDGGVRFASVMTVTLSADHRAVDGALAAQFLGSLRDLIERPIALMM